MNSLETPSMQVEIWSDVMCPFCYIGKRKFEAALAQFSNRDKVDVIWRSFQLDPNQETISDKPIQQYLAERKGMTLLQAQQMTDQVTAVAKQVGLTFRFDKAVTANSFDAHRFSHLAKQHGYQDEAEEKLFAAYFTEGKNTADRHTLAQLGAAIGLDAQEVEAVLQTDQFADAVQADCHEAQQLGVQGVPFFVFNRHYAVSGAQESGTFLEVLQTAFADWEKSTAATESAVMPGTVCLPDGQCA
ncbi:MAG: disulfide bond formation protein DsbA [Spirosoma sp.]|nr:disulfide bond formation protein DsbA [Spirosoma sp.]